MPALSPESCPQHGSATPPRNSPSGSNQTPRLHPEPPHSSPAPGVYYGFGLGNGPLSSLAPSTLAPTPSSLAVDPFYRKIWLLGFSGLFIFNLLCWPH